MDNTNNTQLGELENSEAPVTEQTTLESNQEPTQEGDMRSIISKLEQKIGKLERIVSKQDRQTLDKDTVKTFEDIAANHKVRSFADQYNLSTTQAEELFKIKPNPTKEDMESPLMKGAIEVMKRSEKLSNNMPGSNFGSQDVGTEFKSMSREDRVKAFENLQLRR